MKSVVSQADRGCVDGLSKLEAAIDAILFCLLKAMQLD